MKSTRSPHRNRAVLLFIGVTILAAASIAGFISCGAGVDIGGADRVLDSFSITWPEGFQYRCESDEPVIVTINALDQYGEVFDSWSGDVNISCINVYVSIYPTTVNVTGGSKEIAIVFESLTDEVQQVQIELSYGGVVEEIEDVILVGHIALTGVMATDGLDENFILIKWDELAYAEKYEVYRSETESGTYMYIGDTAATRYQDTDCVGGTAYYYKVRGYFGTSHGYSDLSDSASGYKRNYGFIAKWGSQGTGNGQFDHPIGVAVDAAGNVYVADYNNDRIQKFNSSGGFITKWGGQGIGNGQFNDPADVAVDSAGYVYVADAGNNRIQKFDSSGVYSTQWGSTGTGDGQFKASYAVAVDSSGNVYVADQNNHRIQKFDSNGTLLGWWGRDDLGGTGWHDPGSGRTGVSGTGDGQFDHPFGIAVDASGNIYVADVSNDRIQKFNTSGTFLGWCGLDDLGVTGWHAPGSGRTGVGGTGDMEFDGPRGVAVDSAGNVYVADSNNDRIQKFDSSGGFITKWGSEGTGDGQFDAPIGVAVDSVGKVYVADPNNDRIEKFGTSEVFLTKWGSEGTGDGEFKFPVDVAIDSAGNVYVVDPNNHRIQKFNFSGTFLGWWGLDDLGVTGWHDPGSGRTGVSGTGDGQFNNPWGVTVDSDGKVYVADLSNARIQKFDSNGGFITKWGSYGGGDGQFVGPCGVAVDSAGNVYVADSGNDRIQKFNFSGTFLGWWGRDDLGVTGWHDPGSGRTGVSGTGDGQFDSPDDIAIDADGNVFVADYNNARIQKFDSSGTYITQWGEPGPGDGQFDSPSGVAVDAAGKIYVADMNNHRIQKFDSSGAFITKWEGYGPGDGQFNYPYGVEVDFNGRVYVADTFNNRIQKSK